MQGYFSEESLQKVFDFTTCQRPDGSKYGTSGTCRKGVEIQRVETGYFTVKDASGKPAGMIMAEGAIAGGGGIRESGKQAKYTVKIGDKTREGLTLAAAKAQAKEWLGEKTGGMAKAQVKGGLTAKGKETRVKNQREKVDELRDEYNQAVKKWNSMSPEQRRENQNVSKNIKWLKERYQEESEMLMTLQNTPVAD